MYLFSLILTSFVLSRVLGTFSPSGSVSIDCGGQQIFTCTVASGTAAWTITGLPGIPFTGTNGVFAGNNARVTSDDLTPGATSTITITGFTTADNGGNVQCTDQVGTEEGNVTVVVALVSSVTAVMDQCSANLTWIGPTDPGVNTSVSCTPPSPQCSSCTSSGCTIGGLTPSTSYTFSVTRSLPNCGASTAMSNAVTTVALVSSVTAVMDQCSANLTWIGPTDSGVNTSVSCTPSSPQCSSCTSSGCTIGGLTPSTSFTFSVTRSLPSCSDSTAMSNEVTTVGVPSCPTNVLVTDRSSNFSSATITWEQPTNSPPVTSYDVTCNSSCTAMPCTNGSSTCRVLSVSPCEDYSVTVLPMNNCGSSTGCTENVVPVPSQGIPDCGKLTVTRGNDNCPSFVFTPGTINPSTISFSYSGDSSSALIPNCTYPIEPVMCQQSVSSGTYTVTAIPQNNCGSRSACQPTERTDIPNNCNVTIIGALANTPATTPTELDLGIIIAIIIVVLLLLLVVAIAVYFSIIGCLRWFCYAYVGCLGLIMCLCCPCCKGKARKSSSKQRIGSESPVTPPAQPPAQPPCDEYADPQAIRDRKERGQEDKDMIQYAAIDFSAGAGSGAGEVKIHQKEEPVIYTAIQHV